MGCTCNVMLSRCILDFPSHACRGQRTHHSRADGLSLQSECQTSTRWCRQLSHSAPRYSTPMCISRCSAWWWRLYGLVIHIPYAVAHSLPATALNGWPRWCFDVCFDKEFLAAVHRLARFV